MYLEQVTEILSDNGDKKANNKGPAMQSKASHRKAKMTTAKKHLSGTLYTAVAHTTVPTKGGLTNH